MPYPYMKVAEIMTPYVHCIPADASVTAAAAILSEYNVGTLPVCDEDGMVGIVTDRDLVTRVLAKGRDPDRTRVAEVMTEGLIFAFTDQCVQEAAEIMEQTQVRRLPVLNRDQKLVGIVSITDFAKHGEVSLGGGALGIISHQCAPVCDDHDRLAYQRLEPCSAFTRD